LTDHGALAGLPGAVHALVPELAQVSWPDEHLATCTDCVMAHPHPHRDVFLEDARCCTFFPRLVNYSVGQVLQEGGAGAQVIRGLLRGGARVVGLGVEPEPGWQKQYSRVGPEGFGKTLSLRCPYWVGGELACGIWGARNHVCRTWFCKHVEGERGQALWDGVRDALGRAASLLAYALLQQADPPGDDGAPQDWEAWFIGCAERLETLDLVELRQDEPLGRLRTALREHDQARTKPLADVLGPSLMKWEVTSEGGWVYGYSPYDECPVPGDIWELLSRLDGERTWQQALAETRAAGFAADETLVRALARAGALEPRVAAETEPGLARIKLQGTDGRWTHMGMCQLKQGD